MTDVREGRGHGAGDGWLEPGQDLDDLLTRWGSEQTGPFRRPAGGGRHAASDPVPPTWADDPLGTGPPPAPRSSRHEAPEPPAPRHEPPAEPRPSAPGHAASRHGTPAEPPSRPDAPRYEPQPSAPGHAASRHSATNESGSTSRSARHEAPHHEVPGYEPPRYETPRVEGPRYVSPFEGPRTELPRSVRARPEVGRPAGGGAPGTLEDGGPRTEPSRPGDLPAGGAWAPDTGRRFRPDEAPPAARDTGRRFRADGVPPVWERDGAAPNGSTGPTPPAPLHSALVGAPPAPAPPGPPRFDDTGAYAGWLRDGRNPDAHGLLTHDTFDPYADPGPPLDPAGGDDIPGQHRRAGARSPAPRPRWLRTLRIVGAVLGVLLVVGGGFGFFQYKKLSGNINRIDALSPDDAAIRNAAKQLDAENYLILGSDTRAGDNAKYEETAGQVNGERSDTTILAHLSPNRDKAILVSFPRDAWVSLPECPKTGGGMSPAHDGQFNEAFAIGGPSCTVLAVQKLTGIKINHYIQVDFSGFKTMVDAVGGVPICTTKALRDDESGLRMDPGTSVLQGEQALAYVRARYGIGDGSDLGRIERQQKFLGAMMRAATGKKLLVNPVALTKFLGAATKSLTLDNDTSFGDLKALADQLNGLDPKRVSFVTAPIANPAYNPPGFPPLRPGQGGSKVQLDDVAGRTLWDSIINDKPAAAPGSTTAPKPKNVLTIAPTEVRARVLNGVGTGGLAGEVAGDLQGVGFSVDETSNAPRTTATTVRYAPDQAEAAKTLATAVPGAVLQPDSGTTLDLVIGTNYTGVKTVAVGDPATAKAAAAPKPKPATSTAKPVTAADATCT